MHPELAPPLSPFRRRQAEIDAIALREQQIARLQLEQRHAVAALYRDRAGVSERFVADELALAWRRSPRQATGRLHQALAFADFPAAHALVADGTWLMDHADAVVDELSGSGLDDAQQQQVLELVLSRGTGRTPYELRVAVRTAIVALFPEHAWQRAEKAARDRDVTTHSDAPGSAHLVASGPASDVAAMMASIDALCWPGAPGDTRTLAQRRFDTIRELVCGQAQPGQWQVHVLTDLATVLGEDDLPAEIVGMGPVPAGVARHAAATGELRRVVVDEHGRLVAVDSTVHRPDLTGTPAPAPFPVSPDDDRHDEDVEPDPDAPTAEELSWLEEHTDRRHVYAEQDRARAGRPTSPLPHSGVSLLELRALDLRPDPAETDASRDPAAVVPGMPPRWSPAAFLRVLRRMTEDPVQQADLGTDRYAVPVRLKRHLVLRDRTCVFPGCPRRADRCDKDHVRVWPLGPTSELNLADECEHHHQARHDGFHVRRLPDGTFRWTTPAGHSYDRPPRLVLENYRHRPRSDEPPEASGAPPPTPPPAP